MDILTAALYIILAFIVIQLLRLAFADGDLGLMWAERFGLKPETLKGQVVWITGASSGIGEYLAYELAKAGCRLVLSARSKEQLEFVKKKSLSCGHLESNDVLVLPLDITNLESHKMAMAEVLERFGQLDILVNNAGRSQRAWAIETELAVDVEMIQLNVIGQVSLTKCVLPHMVERGKGHVIITSSLASKTGLPFSATYCLTKHAVNGWFSSLGIELAQKNIAVTIVCPGPVVSNLSNVAFVAKAGDTNKGSQENDKKRMSAERCAELMTVAIANRLTEVWICRQPALIVPYCCQYMPTITHQVMCRLGIKFVSKIREGKV